MAKRGKKSAPPDPRRTRYATVRDVPFREFCRLLDQLSGIRAGGSKLPVDARKKDRLQTFRKYLCPEEANGDDFFIFYRLILPQLDKERANYGLKEKQLGHVIAGALDMSKDNMRIVVNYRKEGSGIFAETLETAAKQYLQETPDAKYEATLGEVDHALDQLMEYGGKREMAKAVVRPLTNKLRPRELYWLVHIILKSVRIGTSEKTILNDFHEKAEEVFNVCCDLRKTIRKLAPYYEVEGPGKAYRTDSVTVGSTVRAHTAAKVGSVNDIVANMKDTPFVVECKFDGERIQLHFNALSHKVDYFTRNMNSRKYNSFDKVIERSIATTQAILDGEMVVWNMAKEEFEPFGCLMSAMQGAENKPGFIDDEGKLKMGSDLMGWHDNREMPKLEDLAVLYMAFDTLHDGDEDVTQLPLSERHERLKKVLPLNPEQTEWTSFGERGIRGKALRLLPGETAYSRLAYGKEDVDKELEEISRRQEEGVVAKSLQSKWIPNDKDRRRWCKLKPDYVSQVEIDGLIIGARKGTGFARGGELSEYLLGVGVVPKGQNDPEYFVSFARVGTGLSEEERKRLNDEIEPYLKAGPPPDWVSLTNNSRPSPMEAVDYWVTDWTKSYVLEVNADVRMFDSKMYASPYSLRFPRIFRIRTDKDWRTTNTVETVKETAEQHRDQNELQGDRTKKRKGDKRRSAQKQKRRRVTESLRPAQNVGQDALVEGPLSGLVIFVSATTLRDEHWAKELQYGAAKLGGNVVGTFEQGTTSCIISDKEGERMLEPYYGMVHILWPDWLAQCIDAQELLPPLASDYLHYAQGAEDIASHLVPFSGCHNEDSVEKLLDAISGNDEAGSLQQLRMAFPAVKQAHLFEGLRLCFLAPPEMKGKLPHSWRYEMSLMEAWAHFHGAEEVSESLNERTTHLVLLLPFKGNLSVRTRSRELESNVDNALEEGASREAVSARHKGGSLKVVTSKWLQRCMRENRQVDPAGYQMHIIAFTALSKPGRLNLEGTQGDDTQDGLSQIPSHA